MIMEIFFIKCVRDVKIRLKFFDSSCIKSNFKKRLNACLFHRDLIYIFYISSSNWEINDTSQLHTLKKWNFMRHHAPAINSSYTLLLNAIHALESDPSVTHSLLTQV